MTFPSNLIWAKPHLNWVNSSHGKTHADWNLDNVSQFSQIALRNTLVCWRFNILPLGWSFPLTIFACFILDITLSLFKTCWNISCLCFYVLNVCSEIIFLNPTWSTIGKHLTLQLFFNSLSLLYNSLHTSNTHSSEYRCVYCLIGYLINRDSISFYSAHSYMTSSCKQYVCYSYHHFVCKSLQVKWNRCP